MSIDCIYITTGLAKFSKKWLPYGQVTLEFWLPSTVAHLKSNFQNFLAPQHVFSNKKLIPVRLRITCPNEELLCSY